MRELNTVDLFCGAGCASPAFADALALREEGKGKR